MRRDHPRALVIGAGSAGLSAAAALARRGVPTLVLEEGDGVGRSWRQRHDELRLNTVRWLSDLRGPRIPRTAGRWVTRDDYVAHLVDFTTYHRLDVRFGVRAERIDRAGDRWRVRTGDGDCEAEHVVVATGLDRVPQTPHWPGRDSFTAPVLHAAALHRVTGLAGRRVLLVGAGNSGVELAAHLVDAPVTQLWVSVRTPPTIMPLEVAGIPLNPIAVALRALPERVRAAAAHRISRLSIGDLAAHGLPAPRQGPHARLRTTGTTAAVDRGFVRHLTAGRLEIVPEIDHLTGADVVLRGGRSVRPDIVVSATGFRPGLEPLVGHLGVLDEGGHPVASAARPAAPGLWFIGYQPAIEGNLRRHPIEARSIARRIIRPHTKPLVQVQRTMRGSGGGLGTEGCPQVDPQLERARPSVGCLVEGAP
ncbi:MAG: NAD(P)/FAD-dependent oxidoreductase [Actinomycetia bacterium]|nr:NAD(P)/FAD-dependent oxidoreductase [Actinomycetes bacterium]